MTPGGIAQMLKRRTAAAFGAPMHPHLIRHSIATNVAEIRPEHVNDIAPMLAHSTQTTGERFYNLAGPTHAVAALERAVRSKIKCGS